MVTGSLKVLNLFQVFRKNNRLDETKALYLFVNGKTLLRSGQLLAKTILLTYLLCDLDTMVAEFYPKYKQEDGFVYLTLSDIATWG